MKSPVAIPQEAIQGVWLRCPSVSGGKDWICFNMPSGIHTLWGKTGQVNQSNYKRSGDYTSTINSKLKKGYDCIGYWYPETGWTESEQRLGRPVEPPPYPEPEKEAEQNSMIREWVSSSDAPEWF